MNRLTDSRIYNCFYQSLELENSDLIHNHNKGIFHLQELTIVYILAKRLKMENTNISWHQEASFTNTPKIDLHIHDGGVDYLFEFKVSNTSTSYEKDIKKLTNVKSKGNLKRYFCALVDIHNPQRDRRIFNLESSCANIKPCVSHFKMFDTCRPDNKNGTISCLLAMWIIP